MSDGNSGFNAVFGGVVPTLPPDPIYRTYGSFSSQLDQPIVIPFIATQIALPITDLADGISVQSDGTIDFTIKGIYMLDATINFLHSAPLSADTGYVWYQKGGVDVADSTRLIRLNPNINTNTLSVSYMFTFSGAVSDNIKLFFTTSSTDLSIHYDNSVSSIPSVSSVICNVFQIA
jgi:hypothetical protein